MERKSIKKSQGGFTLIEIIAVLVILGILAAVAIPRFVALQEQARQKSLESLVAAGQSQLFMGYAQEILNSNGNEEAAWTVVSAGAQNLVNQVSMDGYPTGTSLAASGSNTAILITASGDGQNAVGNFTRP